MNLWTQRNWKKTNHYPSNLAPSRGLPSQCLTTLLVRSYRTFAPLPWSTGRYFSVALSSRSLALGVIQQAWSLGSPDFPQTPNIESATTSSTFSLLYIIFRTYAKKHGFYSKSLFLTHKYSHFKKRWKTFYTETRVIARNTCLNLNSNDYIYEKPGFSVCLGKSWLYQKNYFLWDLTSSLT